ncbi:hypothetical protein PHSY_004801 [Pseudozyma hubeiensis SY62]|uniref:Uncharacterized protein n=1 Tax=Pseudozyma hubeiensis (strain SY62) TaxID=1305764 RepID=R9P785_PSEHS|nr:hypothetical protein PHSY_004801 [Pseudozyma hubeiensis SY62]GAC97216.1 hypothetical protein PHSY_004801 [Pseudozyma hubeiensis SY62]
MCRSLLASRLSQRRVEAARAVDPSIQRVLRKGDHSSRKTPGYVRAYLCAGRLVCLIATDPKNEIFPRSNSHNNISKRSATAFPSGPSDSSPRLETRLDCRRKE